MHLCLHVATWGLTLWWHSRPGFASDNAESPYQLLPVAYESLPYASAVYRVHTTFSLNGMPVLDIAYWRKRNSSYISQLLTFFRTVP